MAKRQLNRRQNWRIEKIQGERAARAAKRESSAVEALEGGDLGPEQHGLVIAHFGVQVAVEAGAGRVTGAWFCCATGWMRPLRGWTFMPGGYARIGRSG